MRSIINEKNAYAHAYIYTGTHRHAHTDAEQRADLYYIRCTYMLQIYLNTS